MRDEEDDVLGIRVESVLTRTPPRNAWPIINAELRDGRPPPLCLGDILMSDDGMKWAVIASEWAFTTSDMPTPSFGCSFVLWPISADRSPRAGEVLFRTIGIGPLAFGRVPPSPGVFKTKA